MGYNLLINEVYWGYNSFTNHLLTSWDIQVVQGPQGHDVSNFIAQPIKSSVPFVAHLPPENTNLQTVPMLITNDSQKSRHFQAMTFPDGVESHFVKPTKKPTK